VSEQLACPIDCSAERGARPGGAHPIATLPSEAVQAVTRKTGAGLREDGRLKGWK